MDKLRKPFQGVLNIIRFNWHFYVLSFIFVLFVFIVSNNFNPAVHIALNILMIIIVCSILISLIVSFYIYDFSNLYKLSWLDNLEYTQKGKVININAGFDETSYLLKSKFENSELLVFDFYDTSKHTEVSIKRAKKNVYPAFSQYTRK